MALSSGSGQVADIDAWLRPLLTPLTPLLNS